MIFETTVFGCEKIISLTAKGVHQGPLESLGHSKGNPEVGEVEESREWKDIEIEKVKPGAV